MQYGQVTLRIFSRIYPCTKTALVMDCNIMLDLGVTNMVLSECLCIICSFLFDSLRSAKKFGSDHSFLKSVEKKLIQQNLTKIRKKILKNVLLKFS